MAYLISIDAADPSKAIRLRACLQEMLAEFGKNGRECRMHEWHTGDRKLFSCCVYGGVRVDRELRHKLAGTLADYVCENLEPEIVRELIREHYPYYQGTEARAIEEYVFRLLESSAWESDRVVYRSRKDKLTRQILRLLRGSRSLAVDGFVRFRMKTYRTALVSCVHDGVREYELDLEYQEFIRLLRRFLSLQPPRVPLVHLIHERKGCFRLVHSDGTPLEWNEPVDSLPELTNSKEDALVGTLLAVAPERLVIHSANPSENVIRTLIQIFRGRIMVCDGCSQCGLDRIFRSGELDEITAPDV
ncbi:putative sporulation protein YtxC [Staphylospora marina]|uniref:putative sporulation protein YtxC n=1 Tax=Staphylospora marina TaxID=2490858 RepID=UPI000F5BD4C0|nr:putative sporulation protein YtxC [Staphylospora marina]